LGNILYVGFGQDPKHTFFKEEEEEEEEEKRTIHDDDGARHL
jgi:hypothetical protein